MLGETCFCRKVAEYREAVLDPPIDGEDSDFDDEKFVPSIQDLEKDLLTKKLR